MMKTKSLLMGGLVLAAVVTAVTSTAALNIGQTDYVTLNRAMALPGVVLQRGSYVFEAVDGHPDIVRVSDRATRRVLFMDYAELIPRPRGAAKPGEDTVIDLGSPALLPLLQLDDDGVVQALPAGAQHHAVEPLRRQGELILEHN